MPRSDADHALTRIRRRFWLIGLVFTVGCAYSKSELQDRLARRVVPDEVGSGRSAEQPEVKTPIADDERHEGAARRRLATWPNDRGPRG